MKARSSLVLPLMLALGTPACGLILGLGDYQDTEGTGAGGPGGAGGTGGTGGGGVQVCSPGTQQKCLYGGTASTEDVGVCKAGKQTCNDKGTGYGACEGEQLPAQAESCSNNLDDDCNGMVNDGCACMPGTMTSCYSGPAGSDGNGICKAGMQTCNADGLGYSQCMGEVLPAAAEDCSNMLDDDCNGMANDGCPCAPGSSASCYSGGNGTEGVGICKAGTHVCNMDGLGYGPCTGEQTPLVEDCTQPEDEDCSGFACSQPLWSKLFGDASGQSPSAVAIDGAGNILVAGTFYGGIKFGNVALVSAGTQDIFVAKLDSAGNHIWSKQFGDAASQDVQAMAVDSAGNVAIVGGFQGTLDFGCGSMSSPSSSNAYVAKLDPNGACVWSKRLGNATTQSATAYRVAVSPTGDVIALGDYQVSIDLGAGALASAGGADLFLAKLSGLNGNLVWGKRFGDAAHQYGRGGVAADPAGSISIAGTFAGTLNLGGSPMTAGGSSLDIFLARFDGVGTHVWSLRFGANSDDYARGLRLDSFGDIIITGNAGSAFSFGGAQVPTGFYVAKFLSIGNHLWSKGFGPASFPNVGVDPMDNILLNGVVNGPVDLGGGLLTPTASLAGFLLKLTPLGAHVWSKLFDNVSSGGVAFTPTSEIVMTVGCYDGMVDFGVGPLTCVGGDVLLAKFAP